MAGQVMEIIDANLRALRSYAPQPLEGLPVLYVRSNSMEEDDARTAYWRGLAGSGFEELPWMPTTGTCSMIPAAWMPSPPDWPVY